MEDRRQEDTIKDFSERGCEVAETDTGFCPVVGSIEPMGSTTRE